MYIHLRSKKCIFMCIDKTSEIYVYAYEYYTIKNIIMSVSYQL